mmetsp:Transcript_38507/g.101579  ORF Transcript_38507/g.101579 Transcript_38507/m.101579 type:complete len:112 (-) Transcript_38507:2720-3055(-)
MVLQLPFVPGRHRDVLHRHGRASVADVAPEEAGLHLQFHRSIQLAAVLELPGGRRDLSHGQRVCQSAAQPVGLEVALRLPLGTIASQVLASNEGGNAVHYQRQQWDTGAQR